MLTPRRHVRTSSREQTHASICSGSIGHHIRGPDILSRLMAEQIGRTEGSTIVVEDLKASPSPTALITAVDDQGAGLCLVEANLYSTSCTMECFVVASSVVSYAS
jgi:hypothetical protein